MKLLCFAVLLSIGGIAQGGTLYLSRDSSANGLYPGYVDRQRHAGRLGHHHREHLNGRAGHERHPRGVVWFQTKRSPSDQCRRIWSYADWVTGRWSALEYTGGILYGALNSNFFTINTATGAIDTTLTSPGMDVEGLAFGNGVLYGLVGAGSGQGNLLAYNIGLNSWSTIGNSGIAFDNVGLAYNPELNVLYATGNQNGNLYQLDPATAIATLIGPTGLASAGGGLAFDSAVPEPATTGLIGLGLLGLAVLRRRRTL